jgi:N-acetylmuramoyl-L-alanine amidase
MIEMFKRKGFKRCAISFFVFTLLFSFFPLQSEAFSPQVIQKGATGDDVIELQARLQFVGYYKGRIDGVFGWGTYWSVRNFQNDYGIEVDGFVGDQMKRKLEEVTWFDKEYVYAKLNKGQSPKHYGKTGKGPQDGWAPPGQREPGNQWERDQAKQTPTPGQPGPGGTPTQPTPGAAGGAESPEVGQAESAINIPDGFTANDLKLMANAVYGEARGEPYEGQVAVAAVILNRVKDSRFPNTVSGVIFEPLAFTAVADGQIWLEPNEGAKRAVQDAINGWDPTNGLVYYFNPDTATSAWMHARQRVKQIGKHVFLR